MFKVLSQGEKKCNLYYKARIRALNNNHPYHIAAILRRRKSVVRVGVNSNKTHPRFKRQFNDSHIDDSRKPDTACMHAEMSVLRFAKPGDTLEVMRFTKRSNRMTMAKPCHFCEAEIRKAKIKYVRYTNWDGDWVTMRI